MGPLPDWGGVCVCRLVEELIDRLIDVCKCVFSFLFMPLFDKCVITTGSLSHI